MGHGKEGNFQECRHITVVKHPVQDGAGGLSPRKDSERKDYTFMKHSAKPMKHKAKKRKPIQLLTPGQSQSCAGKEM